MPMKKVIATILLVCLFVAVGFSYSGDPPFIEKQQIETIIETTNDAVMVNSIVIVDVLSLEVSVSSGECFTASILVNNFTTISTNDFIRGDAMLYALQSTLNSVNCSHETEVLIVFYSYAG